MRIGILTFYSAYNYGAILQAYALQTFLRDNGFNVSIINYRPDYLASKKPQFGIKTIVNRTPIHRFKRYYKYYSNFKNYEIFSHKYFALTKQCETVEEYNTIIKDFDVVIIGSDQVWNKKYNGSDIIWFGGGISNNQHLIAYAVSAGDPNFTEDECAFLTKILNRFTTLSVREEILASNLASLTNKEITVTLDPTLMVSPKVWEKWFVPTDKYIVIYQARPTENVFRIAEQLSLQYGVEIVVLDYYWQSMDSGYHKVVSPSKFVSIIKNALCVVTTSYHGTIFSILMNTPFYTLRLNDGADKRSEELLLKLGLENRMVDQDMDKFSVDMDFSESNKRLNDLRKESQEFLLNALKI